MREIHQIFREKLIKACSRNYAPSVLLSGGIDSSSIATITASELGYSLTAITVSLSEKGPDLYWAERVVTYLKIPWVKRTVSIEEAIEEGIPKVVRIMNSFDLGLLNDLPYYYGMQEAKIKGFDSIMTGDGSDWLNGGYPFLWDKGDRYNAYVADALEHIPWSSRKIAQELGIVIRQPYLDSEFVMFALQIPFKEKVTEINTSVHGNVAIERFGLAKKFEGEGKLWGKVVLREAMKNYLPEDVLWRPREDLEFGSGMVYLEDELEKRISDTELEKIREKSGINFWGGKAQAFLYRLFVQSGEIRRPQVNERICSCCGAGVAPERRHCETCGYFEGDDQLVQS